MNCTACKHAIVTTKIIKEDVHFEIELNYSNCRTKNVIYLCKCSCPKWYVGKTTRQIRTRILEHKSRIRNNVMEAPMTKHLIDAGHSEEDLQFLVIKVLKRMPFHHQNIEQMLLKEENYFIHRLQTLTPEGMNLSL